ncbi:MAG: thiosulfate oxidation carrier complex protein SoxZ [marine bacterium B5-7]|nr:MAG: thiosulfate oxidation carrier complex protein SoxZ [marine bacterium B5-7]
MASSIRLKTKTNGGVTTVRAIIRHPMETGFRVDSETSELVPTHYINEVVVKHNDNVVMSCDWSRAVSKNPYLSFMFKGANIGDKLELSWRDNKNNADSIETRIE